MASRNVLFELLCAGLLVSACGGTTSTATCGPGTVAKNGECVVVSAAVGGATSSGGSTSIGGFTSAGGLTSIAMQIIGGAGGSTDLRPGGSCVRDADCPVPLVCTFNACHLICGQPSDCPDGERCLIEAAANTCLLAAEATCALNSDCPASLVCGLDLQCRNQCAADRDCLPGQSCSSGECVDLKAGGLPP